MKSNGYEARENGNTCMCVSPIKKAKPMLNTLAVPLAKPMLDVHAWPWCHGMMVRDEWSVFRQWWWQNTHGTWMFWLTCTVLYSWWEWQHKVFRQQEWWNPYRTLNNRPFKENVSKRTPFENKFAKQTHDIILPSFFQEETFWFEKSKEK